jgi:hypothetical protein
MSNVPLTDVSYQQPDQNRLILTQSRQANKHAKPSIRITYIIFWHLRVLPLKSIPSGTEGARGLDLLAFGCAPSGARLFFLRDEAGEFGSGFLHAVEDVVGVFEQLLAGRRETDLTTTAIN